MHLTLNPSESVAASLSMPVLSLTMQRLNAYVFPFRISVVPVHHLASLPFPRNEPSENILKPAGKASNPKVMYSGFPE